MHNKIIIISGPTASGKTSLSLKLAHDFNGEIISVDSRQVYKSMDIITGKDLPENSQINKDGSYLFDKIKVWGLDLTSPDQDFDVSDFVKFASAKIIQIQKNNKTPILVGGTAFWLKSLLNPPQTLGIPQNKKLRLELENQSLENLQDKLKKLNLKKFESLNNSDKNNPRRLIRAIEVELFYKKNPNQKFIKAPKYDYYFISLKTDFNTLSDKIKKRVADRLKSGAIKEITSLSKKYNWNLPSMSAIGYKDFKNFFDKKSSLEETVGLWCLHEIQYAKRQITFLKKIKYVHWYQLQQVDSYDKIKKDITSFLNN